MGAFTFGLQGGVPRSALREGRATYPNAGLHAFLLRLGLWRLGGATLVAAASMMRW